MMGGGEPPTPIERVSYIRGGGTGAYINTGITPDETTKIIIWARNWNPCGSSYNWLFGSRIGNEDSMFGANLMNQNNSGKLRVAYGNINVDLSDKWTLMSHYHKYELSANGFYCDDVLVSSVTATTFSHDYPIYLFNCNSGGQPLITSTSTGYPVDISACKIYKNNVLVRDYTAIDIPEAGLYDSISNTVFTNEGSGSLTYGFFNRDNYTPLQYITASGASAFKTPVIGGYSTKTLVTFYPTGTTASWFDVVGGRDATKRFQIFTGNTTSSNSVLSVILGEGTAKAIYSAGAGYFRNKKITVYYYQTNFYGYINNSQVGNTITWAVGTSYSTRDPIAIGATWYNHESAFHNYFVGRLYIASFPGYNYVPAKVNGVAGMYDTYHDTFHPSITATPFTAGPVV